MSVSAFAKEFLFDKIGVKNYLFDIDKNGITRTDGGLKMRPRDMMKFGILYLNNGEWNGKQIISPEWIAVSTEQIFNVGYQDYGWHWWIKKYSINNKLYRSYYAMGHGEQAIIIFPDLSMIVVFTAGNYLEPEHRPFEIIEQYILPSLSPDELLIPAYTTDELKKFEGAYHINTDENIQIVIRDSSLFAIDPSGAEFRLIPASPNYFIVENMMRDVYFVSDQYGNITSAEIFIDGERVDIFKKDK